MSESVLIESALVSVRIVTIDFALCTPIPDLDPTFSVSRSHAVRKVPVIRIFGPTPAGQKTCAHVHGIFPYLYVPVPEDVDVAGERAFAQQLSASLDVALNMSSGQSDARTPHVFKASEVSGTPFYGYHPRQCRFIKLFFYDPRSSKRAAALLLAGAVMGKRLQPHESHVPFVLQFMMDYNLQGMNFLHFAHAKFRRRILTDEEALHKLRNDSSSGNVSDASVSLGSSQRLSDKRSTQRTFDVDQMSNDFLLPEKVERVSTSELEIDVVASDILNNNDREDCRNPGLEALWADERERRALLGLSQDLAQPESPPRRNPQAGLESDSHKFWLQRYREQLQKATPLSEGEAKSTDPDATCNLLPGGRSKPAAVYPSEVLDASRNPSATLVDVHVRSLCKDSGSFARRGAPRSLRGRSRSASRQSSTGDGQQLESTTSLECHENTIIDQAIVNSQSSSEKQDEDDDERELVDLLTELGAARGLGRRQQEQEEEEEAESKEMSQVVYTDDPQENIWEDDEDSFWDSDAIQNIT